MPGLIRGVARTAVVAGTATAVSNRVSRRQAGRWASQGEPAPAYMQQAPPPQQPAPAYAPPPPPPPPAPAAAPADTMDNKITQLQQLGELKEQGVLTQAEFEAQKARVLAS
ncbi:SHOCT domain-containing protein [Streptacidiphilus jiangxiensis]|uniref:Short C-terminal domain-containing protein n=1 Tax=Streptacidiphilus jiangxiensis TaxID=235985 RepID=A0A1H7QSN6_STRJI|nr:SHOCT domain-containing protein [Streptacidiphilus jiangxiensis]SEL50718.1 Short C-terminal domain-containing protein [Streptacidiphilus jiangxiensis]